MLCAAWAGQEGFSLHCALCIAQGQDLFKWGADLFMDVAKLGSSQTPREFERFADDIGQVCDPDRPLSSALYGMYAVPWCVL